MFSQIQLLSIVLWNLSALAAYLPEYTVINNCPFAISIYTPDGLFSNVQPFASTGVTESGLLRPGQNFLYTDVDPSVIFGTMGVGLNELDGDNYYYFLVKDVNNFNAGIRITPSPPPDGLCPIVQCDHVSCPFAFSKRPPPPNFPLVADGGSPPPPFYWCPGASSYNVTFCPSGSFPDVSSVTIRPGLNVTGKCLDVRDAIYADNTVVQIRDCDGSSSQQWYINPRTTQVRAANTNFCLDAGSAPGNRDPMKIWQCLDDLPAQTWYWSKSHNTISVAGKGQCLDVTDGLTGNRQQMQTWECTPSNRNQVWFVI